MIESIDMIGQKALRELVQSEYEENTGKSAKDRSGQSNKTYVRYLEDMVINLMDRSI